MLERYFQNYKARFSPLQCVRVKENSRLSKTDNNEENLFKILCVRAFNLLVIQKCMPKLEYLMTYFNPYAAGG